MRYLGISIPEGHRQAVLDVLEDEGIDYTVADEAFDEWPGVHCNRSVSTANKGR